MVLAAYRKSALLRIATHPVRLGLARRQPYSADGANLTMMDPDLARQTPRHLIPLPPSLPSADPDVIDGTAVVERLSTAARVMELYRQQTSTVSETSLRLLLRRLVRVRSRFQKILQNPQPKK